MIIAPFTTAAAFMRAALLLLFLCLAVPALGQCPEHESAKVTPPTFTRVSFADSDIVVYMDRDTVGFNRSWTFVLSLRSNPPATGGCAPDAPTCSLPRIYNWYIAVNTFDPFPGCPCPQWFWVNCVGVPHPLIPEPAPTSVESLGSAMRVLFSRRSVPIEAGDPYLVTLTTMEGTYHDTRKLAWEFMGTVSPP